MTPGARAQAAIDIIDQILSAWSGPTRVPADKLLQNYFGKRRYIGSKDRGAISERVYWILRHKGTLDWWLDRFEQRIHGRSYVFAMLVLEQGNNFDAIHALSEDGKYGPPAPNKDEREFIKALEGETLLHEEMPDWQKYNFSEWLEPHLKRSFGDKFESALKAMNEQAPTDLRTNTLKTTRDDLIKSLNELGWEATPTPISPIGVRLDKRHPAFTSKAFRDGWFEMQDEGSQVVAQLVEAAPGHRVIDFCAGAGGKTLAMAATMENKGRILAWDVSEKRLSQITQRLRRAGVGNVQTHTIESESDQYIKRHKNTADRVLIDVPCSGTGTWRRNPDLKWRFSLEDLQEVQQAQYAILQSAARLVKAGGRLIYATCSILREENEDQIEKFLNDFSNFRVVCAKKIWDKELSKNQDDVVSYLSLTPHEDGVDGFFAAVLEKTA